MKPLTRPQKLKSGDKIAAVSLSWGGAGDAELLWRYQAGKRQLAERFGISLVEMENTLKGTAYLYAHPEKRAADLMQAFSDLSVRGIFSCIGGDESIRMLPYIDFDIIRKNPKVFLGYSDTTIGHLVCFHAGLSSFYGPSVLAEFAENLGIYPYTANWVEKTLFQTKVLGKISPAPQWTGEYLPWTQENAAISKTMEGNSGYVFLQGEGVVQGRLFGGCIEVLEMAKGTLLWPQASDLTDCILFFETSEDMPPPVYVEYWLRNYGSQGILQKTKALLFGKPYQEKYSHEYQKAVLKILKELGLSALPVVMNMTFGHNQPMCVLPYGALAEVDCSLQTVSILESPVET